MTSEGTPPRAGEAMRAAEESAPGDARRELLRRRLSRPPAAAHVGSPITPRTASSPTELSYAQQRLWFLQQLVPESPFYTESSAIRLRSAIDPGALETTLNEIVRRHEVLRTAFHEVDGHVFQTAVAEVHVELPVVDLSGLDADVRASETRRLALESSRHAFDLSHPPLLRASLLRMGSHDWVFLLAIHHIVCDGWSTSVFSRELSAIYAAISTGRPNPLPPLPIQYADYAAWQRSWLAERMEPQIGYWREQLADLSALDLPTDRPRPATFSYVGAHHRFVVPPAVASALKRRSQQRGVTLFMTLLAGLTVLLHRYCNQDDVVVGCPIANRTRRELEDLIGFFVNTLVLRVDTSGGPTFDELIERVRRTAVDAYAHQDVPFEKVVDELHPRRDLSRNPLFQTIFQLRSDPAARASGAAAFTELDVERSAVKFDLRLDMLDGADGLRGVIEYSTDLFDHDRIERMVEHLLAVLAAMARDPGSRIDDVPLVTAAEVRSLARWGRVTERTRSDDTIAELFHAQADRSPDAIALVAGDEQLTYRELRRRSVALARVIRREHAIAAGAIVGVASTRSIDAVVTILAILECGAAYMPVDPTDPAERLHLMLDRAGSRLVVASTDDDIDRLRALPVAIADGRLAAWTTDDDSVPVPHPPTGPDDLAYVMFTSGSTGEPKGVMVPHRAVVRLVRGADYVDLGPSETMLLLAPLTFDATTLELWGPLLNGGRLAIAPDGPLDPAELHAALERHAVTTLWLTSGLFHFLAERYLDALTTVRQLLSGGDVISPTAVARVLDHAPGCRFVNGYGPTENTTFTCCHQVDTASSRGGAIPIGRPINGTNVVVVDDRLQPTPVGVPGELCIGGAGLSWGYLGDPRTTAERFVPNPYATEPGGRMYRSGDLVQWSSKGVLQFLGRRDRQLKIRGFRVEPGEIETMLANHPAVAAAVVVAHQADEGRRLAAYIVPAEGCGDIGSEPGSDLLANWRELYDDLYSGSATGNARRDFRGWNSSITGAPIPRVEMEAWLDATVEPILAVRPRRVLEIGAGTGLLLFRIAPEVDSYVATDLSGTVVARVRREIEAAGLGAAVALHHRPAHDLDGIDGPFDAVVVNSVVQYFPSADYARDVLAQALDRLAPGGHLFVGDVRSLRHLEALHVEVALVGADDQTPATDVFATALRRVGEERELALDPRFFEEVAAAHAPTTRMVATWKSGDVDNELFRYRYDVVFTVGDDAPTEVRDVTVLDWVGDELSIDALAAMTLGTVGEIHVRDVPNDRVAAQTRAVELLHDAGPEVRVGDIRSACDDTAGPTVRHRNLVAIAEASGRGLVVRPSASGAAHTVDVTFASARGVAPMPMPPSGARGQGRAAVANDPRHTSLASALVPRLREYLGGRLPDYMVPSSFVLIDEIPLTPNGKVRRDALPRHEADRSAVAEEFIAPRDDVESALCDIWAAVIGVDAVGVNDNFFELGGDSIQCIQIIARARSAGLSFTAKQLFEHQTIGELAPYVTRPTEIVAEQGVMTGPTELLPAQLWFLERGATGLDHFNQSVMLELPNGIDPGALASALDAVVEHHDALRLRFEPTDDGWRAVFTTGRAELERHDATAVAPGQRASFVEAWAGSIEGGLDIGGGRCMRAALLDLGAGRPARLLLAVHHLVVDGVSWRILLEDLWVAYAQLVGGGTVSLPTKTSSVRDWAQHLLEHAVASATLDELEWWNEQADADTVAIPAHDSGSNRVRDVDVVEADLDQSTTRAVLTTVPGIIGGHVDDVLVAALVRTVTRWCGRDTISIDVEAHGREELAPHLDVSRTVGWLTAISPARCTVQRDETFAESARSIGATLATRPHRGIGFGVLRYLSPDPRVRDQLAALPPRPISFNYLGQFGGHGDAAGDGTIRAAPEPAGPMRHPDGVRAHLIEVDASVVGERLTFRWSYSRELHDHSRIRDLADDVCTELRRAVADLDGAAPERSRFPAAGVAQRDLDTVFARLNHPSNGEGG